MKHSDKLLLKGDYEKTAAVAGNRTPSTGMRVNNLNHCTNPTHLYNFIFLADIIVFFCVVWCILCDVVETASAIPKSDRKVTAVREEDR